MRSHKCYLIALKDWPSLTRIKTLLATDVELPPMIFKHIITRCPLLAKRALIGILIASSDPQR